MEALKMNPVEFKLFNMSEAEFKRLLFPKSMQWRLNRLAETLAELTFWWLPK